MIGYVASYSPDNYEIFKNDVLISTDNNHQEVRIDVECKNDNINKSYLETLLKKEKSILFSNSKRIFSIDFTNKISKNINKIEKLQYKEKKKRKKKDIKK